ncbi:MAG: GNAT family N-acetyltransferase [Bacillota bacterium]
MTLKIVKTNGKNKDFRMLVNLLDSDLNERYGDLQQEYDQHNKLDYIHDVIIIYKNDAPVACGAFKEYDRETIELKRIFVGKENRRQGLSKLIIGELEKAGDEKGYSYAVLETGTKQHEAIHLYINAGYSEIPNYGPYIGMENSICMKKMI